MGIYCHASVRPGHMSSVISLEMLCWLNAFGAKLRADALTRRRQETADCPICCEDLGRSPQEVGALTYQGKRIERDLYHVGQGLS